MSSPPTPLIEPEVRAFIRVWIDGIAQVLGQIAGSPFPMEEKAGALAGAEIGVEGDFSIIVAASAALRGELAFRMPRLSALAVAQLFLGETQDPAAEFTGECREALEELLRQISGHVATALKARHGEVQMRMEFGNPPSWPSGASGWMGSATGTTCPLWLEWQMSAALIAALRASAPAEAATAAPPADTPAPPAPSSPGAPANSPPAKLDIFMDVPLGVTLRFGGRRMLLKEILELSAGAVVELDREVQEAVDLLLDGKLIARGEVVVVDGNYGLRITQVSNSFVATP